MDTTFEYKKLINETGFYGRIQLEVNKRTERGVSVKYAGDSQWQNAIEFAVAYFYERYQKAEKGGLDVVIKELNTQIVDTSNMVIFFVTVNALYRALSMGATDVYINGEGSFVVPK